MGALKQQKSYYFIKGRSENIHLLLKGKYHCMPEPLFDSIVFDQTSKSVVNST